MAAVFVAGKVEECIRRARDIVNVFHHLYCLVRGLPAHPIDYVGDTYFVWRDRLCTAEAILLRTLGFHVQPASPVPLLISYLKVLELPQLAPELPQLAFSWLNDLLRTPVGVLYQPNVVAASAIDIAATKLCLQLPADWHVLFDVNELELKGCRSVGLAALQGGEEIDLLLPLSREELKIFAEQIDDGSAIETETETEAEAGKEKDYRNRNRFNQSRSRSRGRSRCRTRSRSRSRSRSKGRSSYSHSRSNSHRAYHHQSRSDSGRSHSRSDSYNSNYYRK